MSASGKIPSRPSRSAPRPDRLASWLFYGGWALTLLYFPSGVMHAIFGRGVYFRDILLILHFSVSIYWLVRTRTFVPFARKSWLLVVPALFVSPALFNAAYTVEALTFLKWTVFWLDWTIMGIMALLVVKGLNRAFIVLAIFSALLLVMDVGAGAYERIEHRFILDTRGEVSGFGVQVGREMTLATQLRVKGLQRDVFSYANLMAMGCVGGLLAFVNFEAFNFRLAALGWTGVFGSAMFLSGGRSAFFGVLAASLNALGLLTIPRSVRRNDSRIILGWLLVALTISMAGVGRLAESVGSSVMRGSNIAASGSAYQRDANWSGIREAIEGVPIVLVSGGPMASLIDSKIDTMYHWADNEYLWLVYHSGIIGLLAVCMYFAYIIGLRPAEDKIWLRDGLILYLLFVMGEAIARESMEFVGCMPLFLACGCQFGIATQAHAKPTSVSSSSQRQSGKGSSGVKDFARRIQRASESKE